MLVRGRVPAELTTDHDGDASEDIQRGQALLPRRPLCLRRRRRRRSRHARPPAAGLDVSAAAHAVIGWVRCRAAVDAGGEVDALRRCHGRRSS